MTKKEFFLKTIISMCGNVSALQNVWEAGKGEKLTLKADEIIEAANLMLKKTVQEWPDVFDEPTK